jgi:ATP-dependent RNA helicase DeaD
LQERGFTSVALSGELTQNERTRALQAMRDGQARVCVATDVAARGLDLPDLGLVIHADLPTNKQTLLHRSGRTGRAGRKGVCVLIVPANRARAAESLIASAGVSAAWETPPTAENIFVRDGERLLADPILTEDITPEDLLLGRQLLTGRSAEDIAAALVRLYRSRLPAPEEIASMGPLPGGLRKSPEHAAPAGREDRAKIWFSVNVGRAQKADPKWLLPLICRMGGVEKRDVGAIKIQDSFTRFEIAEDQAESFMANLPPEGSDEVHITRSDAPPPTPRRDPSAPKRFFKTAGPKKAGGASNARKKKA